MKKFIGATCLSIFLLLTGACSHQDSSAVNKSNKEATTEQKRTEIPVLFNIAEAKVTLVTDKLIGGSITIQEKGKSVELVPTSLYYQFKLKQTSDKLPYNAVEDAIDVQVIPSKELKTATKEVLGFNVYNAEELTGGLGKGISIGDFNENGEASLDLNYNLGTTVKNSQMPLVPSKDKLEKLRQKALEGTLVIIRNHKEIARVNLKSLKK